MPDLSLTDVAQGYFDACVALRFEIDLRKSRLQFVKSKDEQHRLNREVRELEAIMREVRETRLFLLHYYDGMFKRMERHDR